MSYNSFEISPSTHRPACCSSVSLDSAIAACLSFHSLCCQSPSPSHWPLACFPRWWRMDPIVSHFRRSYPTANRTTHEFSCHSSQILRHIWDFSLCRTPQLQLWRFSWIELRVPRTDQVHLVRHHDSRRFLVVSEEFVPVVQSLQSFGLGDVEHEHYAMGVLQVRWNETAIAFLSSCVPHLQAVIYSVSSDVLDVEIDADCRLN